MFSFFERRFTILLYTQAYIFMIPNTKLQPNKGEPLKQQQSKDEFINTNLTLRKLQKRQVIPSKIAPTNLNQSDFRLTGSKFSPSQKHLLISNRNIVYYGECNQEGYPQSSDAIFIYSDGSYYSGKVKKGKPEGKGTITNLQNSYSYEGDWMEGIPEGFGIQKISNNVYEGQFQKGRKNGKGTLLYSDGSIYVGDFVDNRIEGDGKYLNKNNYWQGSWKNGYMQGKGKQIIYKEQIKSFEYMNELKSDKCSVYQGEFSKGQKSGFGAFKWNKNYEYEGLFQKGQLHGQGTFKFKGKVYAGVWSNGTEVKITQLKNGQPNTVLMTGNIKQNGGISMSNEQMKASIKGSHSPKAKMHYL